MTPRDPSISSPPLPSLPFFFSSSQATQLVLVVKKLPANAGDIRDMGLIPGLGRSSGGGYGSALQCFCLENPMDRGAWWAAVHAVASSQTWPSDWEHSQAVCRLYAPISPDILENLAKQGSLGEPPPPSLEGKGGKGCRFHMISWVSATNETTIQQVS